MHQIVLNETQEEMLSHWPARCQENYLRIISSPTYYGSGISYTLQEKQDRAKRRAIDRAVNGVIPSLDLQQKILQAVKDGAFTATAIGKVIKRNPKTIRKQLQLLVASEQIYRYGHIDCRTAFYIPEQADEIFRNDVQPGETKASAARRRVLHILMHKANMGRTAEEIANEIRIDQFTVRKILHQLVDQKLLLCTNQRPVKYWKTVVQ